MNKSNLSLPSPHHSLADWDYRPGAEIELATDHYITAPSSLRTQENVPTPHIERLYLKDALAHNIPQGRIIDWRRTPPLNVWIRNGYTFRCQDCPEDALPQNCYWIVALYNGIDLYIVKAGVPTLLHHHVLDPVLAINTWYHFRITFYVYTEADLHVYLRVVFEIEEAGQWVEKWVYAHYDNEWAESAINRIGFYTQSIMTDNYQWVDDTKIWEKT